MMFAIVRCIIFIFSRYVTDILKMCMMKFNDKKIICDIKQFSTTAHI